MHEEKQKQLLDLMERINKEGGKKLTGRDRRIMFASEAGPVVKEPTGLSYYDKVVGGDPRGRWTIDYGVTGAGKSTWNYTKMAIYQSRGMVCALIDAEDAFDEAWCAQQGVNIGELLLIPSQDTFEATLGKVREMMQSRLIDFYLLDSIHGLAMQSEVYKKGKGSKPGKERSLADDTTAAAARKIGQFIRTVGPVLGKSQSIFTIIGQLREDITPYGGGSHLSGGNQLKHHASCIRQWVRAPKERWPVRKVNDEAKIVGFTARLRIEKTKLNACEGQEVFIPFILGEGPSLVQANVDAAVELNMIQNPSATHYHWPLDQKSKNIHKMNGRPAVYQYFEDNPKQYGRLMKWLSSVKVAEDKDA